MPKVNWKNHTQYYSDMKTYKITYRVITPSGVFDHVTRVRNCFNEFHAKCKLHDFARRKYPQMTGFVITEIRGDNPFMDIFEKFT